jgi:membrane-associated phospholipid phosphatase
MEMYYLVPAINPVDFDASLILIDRFLFGTDVTVWTMGWSHPLLTEILQIAYSTYYFLPLILTIDLYRRKRVRAFKQVFLFVILGFYLSYLGYVAVPAIGPRFTQHEFASIDQELPGLFATSFLRSRTNAGESIPDGTLYPAAKVQRDVFPSGHTEVTLLVMLVAFRFRARSRWFLLVTGSLLIVATVYLRYHYVIDLIAGGLFAWLTLELGALIDEKWTRWRERAALAMIQ